MRKNTQSGFSLVELMVVVAIIGILATVAIPRINKFVAKSRTTEAQTNLAGIHTANKAFYNEYQGYTSAFDAMGYRPEGRLRYNTGFTGAADGPANYTAMGGGRVYGGNIDTLTQCPIVAGSACQTMIGADGNPPAAPVGAAAPSTPYQTFTAGSGAVLASGVAADTWTINQDKTMTNTFDGTGN